MESKFNSLAEWRKADPKAYNYAYRNGLLEELCNKFNWYYFEKPKSPEKKFKKIEGDNINQLKKFKNKLDSINDICGIVDIHMDTESLNIVTPHPINSILLSYDRNDLINCDRFDKLVFLDKYYFCKVKIKDEHLGLVDMTIPLSISNVDTLVVKIPISYDDKNYFKIINDFYSKWKPIIEKEKKESEELHNNVMKELFGNNLIK